MKTGKMKKALSFVLSFMMVLGVFSIIPFTLKANADVINSGYAGQDGWYHFVVTSTTTDTCESDDQQGDKKNYLDLHYRTENGVGGDDYIRLMSSDGGFWQNAGTRTFEGYVPGVPDHIWFQISHDGVWGWGTEDRRSWAGSFAIYVYDNDGNLKLSSADSRSHTGDSLGGVWSNNVCSITNSGYYVVFDGNGADGGSTAKQLMFTGVASALHGNGYARTGCSFGGWATSPGGGAVYSDGQQVADLAAGNSTAYLYATWSGNIYTLDYNPDSNAHVR